MGKSNKRSADQAFSDDEILESESEEELVVPEDDNEIDDMENRLGKNVYMSQLLHVNNK
eukprot:gene368-958_t